ncbi:MAG: hypothetical protein HY685_01990 [Chloroflexi bacterium]|nr:hypothetical protein [Chloroflexota bacterium]
MTARDKLIAELNRKRAAWEKARKEADELRSQVVTVGPIKPGRQHAFPIADNSVWKNLEVAEEREREAFSVYLSARDALRG